MNTSANEEYTVDIVKQNSSEIDNKYLTFLVSNQLFGIPVSSVLRLLRMQEIKREPDMPKYVRGVIRHEDEVIPVIDTCLRFGRAMSVETVNTCILVCEIKHKLWGFIIDEIKDVVDIDNISPPPFLSRQNDNDVMRGFGKCGDKVIVLLEPHKLI